LIEQLIAELGDNDDYKILRRLNLPASSLVEDDAGAQVAIIIDCETTGLDVRHDRIIELAMRRFRFNEHGVITKIDQPYSWLEDPGIPLNPVISRLTGLTDADLAGRFIDDRTAIALLNSAEVCIAHNAGFDRKFLERRLPECAGKKWACSLREIDWVAHGFDGTGRSLGWLLAQCGWFFDAHRAAADVDGVIAILNHRLPNCRTALAELLETAAKPAWLIRALGAHYDVKDALKGHGYRWDPEVTAWYTEIPDEKRDAELEWLSQNVYAPQFRPRLDEPSVHEITWFNRYA
jgi:DNA polymerase-3 subunit epsilon